MAEIINFPGGEHYYPLDEDFLTMLGEAEFKLSVSEADVKNLRMQYEYLTRQTDPDVIRIDRKERRQNAAAISMELSEKLAELKCLQDHVDELRKKIPKSGAHSWL